MQLRPRESRGRFSSHSSELDGVWLNFTVPCCSYNQPFSEEKYLDWLQRLPANLLNSFASFSYQLIDWLVVVTLALVLPFSIHSLYPATEFLGKGNYELCQINTPGRLVCCYLRGTRNHLYQALTRDSFKTQLSPHPIPLPDLLSLCHPDCDKFLPGPALGRADDSSSTP